jgi:hypothetical protein
LAEAAAAAAAKEAATGESAGEGGEDEDEADAEDARRGRLTSAAGGTAARPSERLGEGGALIVRCAYISHSQRKSERARERQEEIDF